MSVHTDKVASRSLSVIFLLTDEELNGAAHSHIQRERWPRQLPWESHWLFSWWASVVFLNYVLKHLSFAD